MDIDRALTKTHFWREHQTAGLEVGQTKGVDRRSAVERAGLRKISAQKVAIVS